jgi:hypothetical protein
MDSLTSRLLTFLNEYIIYIFLFIIFFLCAWLLRTFLKSNKLHKNHKFIILLQLVSSFGAVALGATLFLTVYFRQEVKNETAFQNYASIWATQNEFIQQFIDHPEMEYFHSDLYGKSYLNKGHHYKRNIILERNFFAILMNDITTAIDYLSVEKYTYNENTKHIKSRLDKLMSLHVKSKYFLQYWKEYKALDAPPILLKYMKENYNI